MSVERKFISVPMQNTEKHEKITSYFPFLLSIILNNLETFTSTEENKNHLLINNIGLKIDREFKNQTTFSNRKDLTDSRLKKRLDFLRDKLQISNITPYQDDDPQFYDFIASKISSLLSQNIIEAEKMEVRVCTLCGHQIERDIDLQECNNCSNNEFKKAEETVLVLNLSNKVGLIEDKLVGYQKKKVNTILSKYKALPDKLIVSRKRDYGFTLDDILNVNGRVLDPKLTMALLPEFVAKTEGIQELVQITAQRHVLKGAHFSSAASDYNDKYLLLAYADFPKDMSLEEDFLKGYVQLYQIGKDLDLKENTVTQVKKEFQKLSNQLTILTSIISSDEGEYTFELDKAELEKNITSILQEAKAFNFEKSLLQYRNTIKSLCKQVIKKEEYQTTLSPEVKERLKNLINLYHVNR